MEQSFLWKSALLALLTPLLRFLSGFLLFSLTPLSLMKIPITIPNSYETQERFQFGFELLILNDTGFLGLHNFVVISIGLLAVFIIYNSSDQIFLQKSFLHFILLSVIFAVISTLVATLISLTIFDVKLYDQNATEQALDLVDLDYYLYVYRSSNQIINLSIAFLVFFCLEFLFGAIQSLFILGFIKLRSARTSYSQYQSVLRSIKYVGTILLYLLSTIVIFSLFSNQIQVFIGDIQFNQEYSNLRATTNVFLLYNLLLIVGFVLKIVVHIIFTTHLISDDYLHMIKNSMVLQLFILLFIGIIYYALIIIGYIVGLQTYWAVDYLIPTNTLLFFVYPIGATIMNRFSVSPIITAYHGLAALIYTIYYSLTWLFLLTVGAHYVNNDVGSVDEDDVYNLQYPAETDRISS